MTLDQTIGMLVFYRTLFGGNIEVKLTDAGLEFENVDTKSQQITYSPDYEDPWIHHGRN